jgi:splicing factor 3A subunit 1
MPPVPPVLPPLPPPPPPFVEPYSAGTAAAASVTQLSEEDFTAKYGDTEVTLTIQCPADESLDTELRGTSLSLTVPAGVRATVRDLKDALMPLLHGMPPNKQQLRDTARGFLKDTNTLAYYNLSSGAVLELVPRKRGR